MGDTFLTSQTLVWFRPTDTGFNIQHHVWPLASGFRPISVFSPRLQPRFAILTMVSAFQARILTFAPQPQAQSCFSILIPGSISCKSLVLEFYPVWHFPWIVNLQLTWGKDDRGKWHWWRKFQYFDKKHYGKPYCFVLRYWNSQSTFNMTKIVKATYM